MRSRIRGFAPEVSMLLSLLIILASIGADQLTKYLASTYLYGKTVTVIPHVVDFTYVENRGAAFGMLADNRWVFLIVSTVMIAAIAIYLFAAKHPSILERVSLALIVGGGIGNMIDRIASGYVVDFIDVTFVKFYVFNVADSLVCIGCGLMVIWCIADSVRESKKKKAEKAAADKAENAGKSENGDTAEAADIVDSADTADASADAAKAEDASADTAQTDGTPADIGRLFIDPPVPDGVIGADTSAEAGESADTAEAADTADTAEAAETDGDTADDTAPAPSAADETEASDD